MLEGQHASVADGAILKPISPSDTYLLERYLSVTKLPCKIRSPLRDDDDTPSLAIRRKDGVVFWHDFGTGEGGRILALLAKMWGVSMDEAVTTVLNDKGDAIGQLRRRASIVTRAACGEVTDIAVELRSWTAHDVAYWRMFGIGIGMCKRMDTFPVRTASLKYSNGIRRTIPLEETAYAYMSWTGTRKTVKIYQPLSKRMKWLGTSGNGVWDMWTQAIHWRNVHSDSDIILTSSHKDAMCLWSTLGTPAVSMQSEAAWPDDRHMDTLFSMFRNVWLWYDNDFGRKDGNPGQDNAARLVRRWPKLRNICIPDEFLCKDPSDLYRMHGPRAVKFIFDGSKK